MQIIEVKDYEEMSLKAAQHILNKVKNKNKLVLGLATGGTPQGLYSHLAWDHQKNNTSYTNVTSFNLDEYIGIPPSDPTSYFYYMYETFFSHIDHVKENAHIPNGLAANLDEECKRYEHLIQVAGGIDLQVLGIGRNGHIGFNEPGTSFESPTHVVELTNSTRQANAKYFHTIEKVPTHAITMGIKTILKSREILLLASGESKQDALVHLITGEITEQFPASALKYHSNTTVIADEVALHGVKQLHQR
ncbi:glucosamine-6-phosphate deaminase [Metabacillus sp. HB246100]